MNLEPTRLTISPDGDLDGATRHYQKRLSELADLYRSEDAWRSVVAERGADAIAYSVADQRYAEDEGELIVGTSTLQPGLFGQEYAMTRGHLHARASRGELYHCLSGHGLLLLERLDGASSIIELGPGQATNVPGHWIHRSVNTGDRPFVTLFCYSADAGQDYSVIADAGGMRTLVVEDQPGGWRAVPNPDHTGYRREQLDA